MSCKSGACWKNDYAQFARMLSEIKTSGLSDGQYENLKLSMNLDRSEVDKVLERADSEWEKMKSSVK